ncbi:oligosaccharide flippase family protein [Candidatus Halobonum tyrrellensis]|uniref:Membrane protein n=1 Tax=Candidatus Halobonum tyrrellensis G22 TaxID=1324957 RepID=V4IUQ5_9EURY|nr:oligosaccharide flippase family protein [Candidatus Halobonum tyrrellensis]ESP86927.1 membrane protein [Candidatus Halobonum tyrrellensis G22]
MADDRERGDALDADATDGSSGTALADEADDGGDGEEPDDTDDGDDAASAGRSGVALFVARAGVQALGFLGVIYFARELGAAGLGVFFTFQTVISVLGIAVEVGVPGAVVKRVSQADDTAERGTYLTGGLLLTGASFALVSAALFVVRGQVGSYVGYPAAAALAALVLGMKAGTSVVMGTLRGERRVTASAGAELVGQVVRLGVSVGLLVEGFGVVGLMYGVAVGTGARAVAAYVASDTRPGRPTRESLRRLWNWSGYTVGMEVSTLAYNWADTLVLAAVASKAVVGVYEAAWQLSAVSLLAAQAIGVTLAPNVTKWHENGEDDRVANALTTGVTFALTPVVPGLVGAALLGDAVLSVLYGFESGHRVLVLLFAGQIAGAVKNVTQNVLFGVNRPETVFWTNMLSLAGNVVLNLVLIPRYGPIGAAVATASTATLAAASQIALLRRSVAVRADWRGLAWQTGAALAMGGVVFAGASRLPTETVPGLVGLVAVGAAVFGVGMLANGRLRDRLRVVSPW